MTTRETRNARPARRSSSSISPSPSVRVLRTASHTPGVAVRFLDWMQSSASVEYSGFYSLEKLYAFQLDTPPGFCLGQVRIWQAALPTFLVVIGMELVPLADPSLPWTQHGAFFGRVLLRSWVVAVNINVHVQELIPQLQRPRARLVLLAVLQCLPFTGTVLAIAALANVFPVPFSTLAPLVPTAFIGLLTRYVSVRFVVHRDPVLHAQLQRFEQLVVFVFSLIFVYSAYGFVFRRVDARSQVALSFILYAIKLSAKTRMWRLSHVQDHHDLSGESVACGVHLFHALFTITCLQAGHSYGSFVILLGLGLFHDALAVQYLRLKSHDLSTMINELKRDGLATEDHSPFHAQWTAQQMREAQPHAAHAKTASRRPVVLGGAAYFRHHMTALDDLQGRVLSDQVESPVVSLQPALPSASQRKTRATHAVAQLLHCREVVLLRMFVDIFVPLFYLAYCLVLLLLPTTNRRYFDSLRGLDWASFSTLHRKVSILVLTKMATICGLSWLFYSHGQPLGVQQLVFVMRSQRRTMQAWFLINFLQVIDFSLAHMGNDLSFEFNWIHTKP